MSSGSPAKTDTDGKHFEATEQVLNDLTDKAKDHDDSPHKHLHIPANHEEAHSRFRALFPYKSLDEFENSWHLGNYVIDRETNEKFFEPMSIYVRAGMHLLYYGKSLRQRLLKVISID